MQAEIECAPVREAAQRELLRLEALADVVDNIFTSLTQRLVNSARYVEEHEEIQTGSTRLLVEDALHAQARHIDQTAEEIIRITSKEIHLT